MQLRKPPRILPSPAIFHQTERLEQLQHYAEHLKKELQAVQEHIKTLEG